MGQIPYTLKFRIGKPNKLKECLVYLRYYSAEADILIPTSVRILANQFSKGKNRSPIKGHPNADEFNITLNKIKVDVERRIHNIGGAVTAMALLGGSTSTNLIKDFILSQEKLLKGKLSNSTIKQFGVIRRKIEEFEPNATFRSVSIDWLQRFESSIRDKGIANNTVNTNIKKLKALFSRAVELGLMDKAQYEKFKTPTYIQNIPVYLVESEIDSFAKIVESCAEGPVKRAGYYFLLGCYTGLRISDLSAFVYSERMKEGAMILRAKKNKNIVSLPLYPKLKKVLEYCKKHTLSMFEQDMRDHVKTIAKLAGIKQDVKVHSARHSFAMLMLEKGLTIDEVAELLGDSKDVARVYARIMNKQLHRRVLEVMK